MSASTFIAIKDVLLALLAEVRVANGFNTDAGQQVLLTDDEEQIAAPNQPGMISVYIDAAESDEQQGIAPKSSKLIREVWVSTAARLGAANRSDWFDIGEAVAGDLKRALFRNAIGINSGPWRNILVKGFTLNSQEVIPPDDGSSVVRIRIQFTVHYLESYT